MNTHKNANKQGEKILLGGVAAAALGLINAKPQTVKAANQNGSRATKKAASRAVKTKLNYQTETTETNSKTVGEAAANDDTGHLSDNQNTVSDTSAGQLNNNIDSNTNSSKVISKGNYPNNTQEPKTGKHVIATKSTDIQYGKWYGADATFSQNTLTIKGNQSANIPQTSSNESANVASGFTDDLHNTLVTKTDQIYKVVIEGPVKVTGTLRSMFFNLPRLTTIEGLGNLDTSNVTDMSSMFADCPKLTTIEGLDQLDASNVTNMSQMFENCPGLETIDLSKMKIGKGKLTNLSQMFMGCYSLKQLVLPDSIDTSAVTDMQNMFYACSSLTELNLKNVTTDSLQNMNHMFAKCSNLKKLDLSSFYTKSGINMKEIFSNSEDNVTKFPDCVKLEELNIENFDMSQAIQSNGIKNALNKLPALRKLVLGKNCKFYNNDTNTNVGLDTPGTWVNVGNGTEKDPEMSKKWSSIDLMNNYNGETDHDTYIRFYDGYPVKIHYVYCVYPDKSDNLKKQPPILDKDGKSYDYVVAGDNGKTSDPINTKNIYGYTIKSIYVNNDKQSSTDKVTVTFTDQEQDVYFVYDRATGKPITVNYLYFVDEKGDTKPILDKDNKPMTEKVDGVLYGDQKDIIPKPIPGYTIKQINIDYVKQPGIDKATVGYSDKDQTVDFIYTKNPVNNENKVKAADVTVHYKDEFGNTIAPDEILSGYVGDGYTTGAKNISGYTLKTRPDNATGFFSTFPQDVTYIYTKIGTNNTPNINEPNTPTKIPKQNKKRKEKKNPTKQAASRNLSKKQGISSVAKSKKAAALPQTGTNKHSSLALLALGSLTLVGALGAAWFSRKKIK
ncbi:BspA family leucine-rich repeat surface protein [Lactobacillus helsingborgensis]|uniref:BspA family leucine-rich repeat surface protein n=1 Tax=Lactobacillus helsingborgensis TaxID=1218494 RepID=UPI00164F8FC9|nr:BspA family leucine-rich repeat surface protein [Lactobacillus helsingborgensis]MBC6356963.1 BspA family leucine-rich repeat surface protein [Lactobacillus helsingborgensis]